MTEENYTGKCEAEPSLLEMVIQGQRDDEEVAKLVEGCTNGENYCGLEDVVSKGTADRWPLREQLLQTFQPKVDQ